MRLTNLKLENFRAFKYLDIDFHPRLNVFIGSNGCGKSSVIDAVRLLQTNLFYRLIDIFLIHDKSNFFSKNIDAKSFWETTFFSHQDQLPRMKITDNRKLKNPCQINCCCEIEDLKYVFHYVYIPLEREQLFDDDQDFVRKLKSQWQIKNYIPLSIYLPVTRAIFQSVQDENTWHHEHVISAWHNALVANKKFHDFLQWFQFRENLENETRLDLSSDFRDHQLETIRHAIANVIPGFENHTLRVRRRAKHFVLTKGGEEFLLDQLSDGEKCFIAMVADIARRLAIANPDSLNPLAEPVLVMIDEVELHLHPGWQRIILPRLLSTFTGAQFLVTTHSPTVLSEVPNEDKKVWSLKMDAEGCAIATEITDSYGLEANLIMEDLMGIPARPKEAGEAITRLFDLIIESQLQEAETLLHSLQAAIRFDDPDLVRAGILLQRKKARNETYPKK